VGGVTGEGQTAGGVEAVWEFFANAELQFVGLLTQGEEFSYAFGGASMMGEERGG